MVIFFISLQFQISKLAVFNLFEYSTEKKVVGIFESSAAIEDPRASEWVRGKDKKLTNFVCTAMYNFLTWWGSGGYNF